MHVHEEGLEIRTFVIEGNSIQNFQVKDEHIGSKQKS